MNNLRIILLCALMGLGACASTEQYTPLLRAEPEINGNLTRTPRTLRLFYAALPDVPNSTLKLTGPTGELGLRGLHTMAADDLMIEILDDVVDGEYTVEWSTRVEGDAKSYSGSYQFTVNAN